MKKAILGLGLILASAAQAKDLSCKVIDGTRCYGKATDMTCFEDIALMEKADGDLTLTYRAQPLMREIYALPTALTETDHGVASELAKGIDGLVASWDMGEYSIKLMQTLDGSYVGDLTLEQDFPLVVHCK